MAFWKWVRRRPVREARRGAKAGKVEAPAERREPPRIPSADAPIAPPAGTLQPGEGPPGEMSDDELIEAVAGAVVRRGLAVPAVFFLESTKPLSFVGSQALIFLQPFVEAFLSVRNYQRFAALMESRDRVEQLIQRVEALDEQQRAAEKDARRRKKGDRAAERVGGGRKLRHSGGEPDGSAGPQAGGAAGGSDGA